MTIQDAHDIAGPALSTIARYVPWASEIGARVFSARDGLLGMLGYSTGWLEIEARYGQHRFVARVLLVGTLESDAALCCCLISEMRDKVMRRADVTLGNMPDLDLLVD